MNETSHNPSPSMPELTLLMPGSSLMKILESSLTWTSLCKKKDNPNLCTYRKSILVRTHGKILLFMAGRNSRQYFH